MKKYKIAIIIPCIVVGSIILGFVIFCIIYAIMLLFGFVNITDLNSSFSVNYSGSNSAHLTSYSVEPNVDLQWYDTLEEALQNDELIKGEKSRADYKESDAVALIQIQTDDRLVAFYTRVPKEGSIGRIICVMLEIRDGKYSQPYDMHMYGNRPGYTLAHTGKPDFVYDCDDGIVFYVLQETVIWRSFGNRQGQIPVIFGMWSDQNEIESLTVAGQSPKVIPVVAEEDTRYFWYFDNVDWLDRLETIDWSNFTYGQIIDILEIKYDITTKWWTTK